MIWNGINITPLEAFPRFSFICSETDFFYLVIGQGDFGLTIFE